MICCNCNKEMVYLGDGNYGCSICGRMLNDLVYREYKSPSAGKENGTNGDSWRIDYPDPSQNPTFISIPDSEPKIYQQGWVCPKCGGVYSPSQNCCPNCTPVGKFTC